ncbi:MAG: rhodanese-like domain-containing protein [Alphaproteobacteria bacterium]|nr:rhodanese-like domain-containing protein [Alphaproteobacteria bacterium]
MSTPVTETPAAASDQALRHFEAMLTFETDCWDVHESLKSPDSDFILVDVRSPGLFAKGHVRGAINIPHGKMTAARMAAYPPGKVFVVYCAGPHCNGTNKAAVRLARRRLPVKMMIGGIAGWLDEGFALATLTEVTE